MRKSLVICILLLIASSLMSKQDDTQLKHLQNRINGIAKAADSLTFSKNQLTRLQTAQWLYDSLEEIFENKEQIEVSRFYERLPKPHAIAIEEWLNDRIYHRNTEHTNP